MIWLVILEDSTSERPTAGVRLGANGGKLVLVAADGGHIPPRSQRQADIRVISLVILHGQVIRIWEQAVIGRVDRDGVVVVLVVLVIAADIQGDAARGIPTGSRAVLLEETAVIRRGRRVRGPGSWYGTMPPV